MKTNINRMSLAFIAAACAVSGCTRTEAPATPAEAPSPATAAVPPPDAGAGAIAAGTYEVCDVADTVTHGDATADHLTGKKVQIQRINPKEVTPVCIGREGCPGELTDPQFDGTVLWMIGDENLLRAVHLFEHDVTGEAGKAVVPHLVQILKDPSETPPEQCKKSNVLILRICHPHAEPTPTSQWQCGSSAGPHGASAHIEN